MVTLPLWGCCQAQCSLLCSCLACALAFVLASMRLLLVQAVPAGMSARLRLYITAQRWQ